MKRLNYVFMLIALVLVSINVDAQSRAEIEKKIADVEGKLNPLQTELDDLNAALEKMPILGWKFGGDGTMAFSMAGANERWVNGRAARSNTIAGGVNLFANMSEDKFFWNNGLTFKLGFQKLGSDAIPFYEQLGQTNNPDLPAWDAIDFNKNLDELYLSSLFGYKFTEVLAASVLFDYRTALFDGSFNNPGNITLGAGITYTPNDDFFLVFHPLTWRYNMAKDISLQEEFGVEAADREQGAVKGASSFGAKLVADYKRNIWKDLNYRTNLNIFLDYTDFENPEITWVNGLGYSLNKYISLSFEYAIRYYKPETRGAIGTAWTSFNEWDPETLDQTQLDEIAVRKDGLEDHLQTRYVFGITFATNFSKSVNK